MSVPLPDPIVGGRGARSLENLDEFERVLELERRLESIQRNFDKLAGLYPLGAEHLIEGALAAALATPVHVLDYGGTLLAGAGGQSYICNKDSTPKLPATGVNQVIEGWSPDLEDDPPSGYKVQYRLAGLWFTNGANPGGTWFWALWETTANGGGAGVYTQTMAGAFTNPVASVVSPSGRGLVDTGWIDSAYAAGGEYIGAVSPSGVLAANSAMQWRMRLYRRFIPE